MSSWPSEDEYRKVLETKQAQDEQEEWETDPHSAYLKARNRVEESGDSQAMYELDERYRAAQRALRGEEEEEAQELTPEEREAADERFYADLDLVPDGDREGTREVLRKHNRLGGEEG